jgi:nitrile hydratase accessory protein
VNEVDSAVSEMDGVAALPRRNGELAFDEPWQGRVFGAALAVVQEQGLDWDEFRQRLITAIGDDPERTYWESWLCALERLLADLGLDR